MILDILKQGLKKLHSEDRSISKIINIEILRQELKKLYTDLRGGFPEYFVNHSGDVLYIACDNDNWSVYVKKYQTEGGLSNEKTDLKEYDLEGEACADFLQREKEYQDRKIKAFEDKYSDTPMELTVITDSAGFGGYSFVKGLFIYSIGIIAWCGNDNVVKQGKARLDRKMTSEEKTVFMKNIGSAGIYRIKARASKENANDIIFFYLDRVIKKTSHPELQRILESTFTPVSIQDERLGRIVLNRKTERYEANLRLWKGKGTLVISIDSPDSLKQHLPAIKKHLAWLEKNKKNLFNEIATDKSIANANNWRSCSEAGEPYYEINGRRFTAEITKEIFIEALDKCQCDISLEISDNQYYFSLYLITTQPDLFAGHAIQVFLDVIDDRYKYEVGDLAGLYKQLL